MKLAKVFCVVCLILSLLTSCKLTMRDNMNANREEDTISTVGSFQHQLVIEGKYSRLPYIESYFDRNNETESHINKLMIKADDTIDHSEWIANGKG